MKVEEPATTPLIANPRESHPSHDFCKSALRLRQNMREASPMEEERRNIRNRAAIVQHVIEGIVQNPSVTLTVRTLQQWLGVPMDAAERILNRLASSGLVKEVQRGVWARGSLGAAAPWY